MGFNNMRAEHVRRSRAEDCTYDCEAICAALASGMSRHGQVACQAKYHTYKRSHELWEQLLCAKPVGSNWHHLECTKGNCSGCGTRLIPLCDGELDPTTSTTMKWHRFEKVNAGMTKKGEPKFALRLEYKETNPKMFLAYAAPKIW